MFMQLSTHWRLCCGGKGFVFARLMTTLVSSHVCKQIGKPRKLLCLKQTPNVYGVRTLAYVPENMKYYFSKHSVDPSKAILIYRNGNYKRLTIIPVLMQMCCAVIFPTFCWKNWQYLNLNFSQFSIRHPTVHTFLAALASLNAFLIITVVHRRLGSLHCIYKYKDSNSYLGIIRNYSNVGTKQVKFTQQECEPYVGGTKVGNIKIKNHVYHVSPGHFTTVEYLNEIMGFSNKSEPGPIGKYITRKRKK